MMSWIVCDLVKLVRAAPNAPAANKNSLLPSTSSLLPSGAKFNYSMSYTSYVNETGKDISESLFSHDVSIDPNAVGNAFWNL